MSCTAYCWIHVKMCKVGHLIIFPFHLKLLLDIYNNCQVCPGLWQPLIKLSLKQLRHKWWICICKLTPNSEMQRRWLVAKMKCDQSCKGCPSISKWIHIMSWCIRTGSWMYRWAGVIVQGHLWTRPQWYLHPCTAKSTAQATGRKNEWKKERKKESTTMSVSVNQKKEKLHWHNGSLIRTCRKKKWSKTPN